MMRNIVIVGIVVLVIVSIPIAYQKFQGNNYSDRDRNQMSDYQQESIRDDLETMQQVRDQIGTQTGTSPSRDQESEDFVVNQTMISSDNALKASFQQGILGGAEIYYSNNGNYGISANQNVCKGNPQNETLEFYIGVLNRYTKSPASCVVGSAFPTNTFTVIAKANTESGYFCADQNGFAGVVPTTGGAFKSGVRCK